MKNQTHSTDFKCESN